MNQKTALTQFLDEVWNSGDFRNLERLTTNPYQVLSDPGDPWNGLSLDYQTLRKRVAYTRNAFPDVYFDVQEMIDEQETIAIRWVMSGTHTGNLPGLPASGKPFAIEGMTFYYFTNGKISGHRQSFNQLGFLAQIGRLDVLSGNPIPAHSTTSPASPPPVPAAPEPPASFPPHT